MSKEENHKTGQKSEVFKYETYIEKLLKLFMLLLSCEFLDKSIGTF